MRICLTNDDGIRAPGIVALYRALAGRSEHFDEPIFGRETEILVVAPETVQSATSHGVTFNEPLMSRRTPIDDDAFGIAVDGRPADCAKLALSQIWPEHFGEGSRPDVVISGMNAGANCGINVIYSGTVAAALESAFLGVPSVAVSLLIGPSDPDFDLGAAHARRAIERVLAGGALRPHECININIPRCEMGDERAQEMPPIHVCPMNTHGLVDAYERRVNPAGHPYYWAAGGGLEFREIIAGSDVQLLLERSITVTPLMYDLTRHQDLDRWKSRLAEAATARSGEA